MDQCNCHTYAELGNFDPTRTTALRNAFANTMKARFRELKKVIRVAIVDQDCFGYNRKELKVQQMFPPGQNAFSFSRSSAQVEAFMRWLRQQVDRGILTVGQAERLGESVEGEWTNMYILDSYKRGILRARYEMIAAGMSIPSIEESGGISAVLGGTPFHMDRVGVLFTRTYSDLVGITDAMSSIIARILSQGMIDGDNPRLMARKLVAAIDGEGLGTLGIFDRLGRFIPAERRAEMLARTEIIRAFHLAAIQEYRNFGIWGVTVKAEWVTAGDNRVCEQCRKLDGRIFTLDEIEPMIPMHPMCRCLAIPYFGDSPNFLE